MLWVNTSPLVKTYTLEEFWELPNPEDGAKLELIAGVLSMTPPPDYKHIEVVTTLMRLLDRHLMTTGNEGKLYVPRASIWTGPHTWVEPDVCFFYTFKVQFLLTLTENKATFQTL